jgi:hypothetical protein
MTMSQQEQPILDSEAIVRIIRQEWLVDGVLQQSAFTLKPQETYLSVNRPAVDTYDADVQSFVSSHASFQFDNGKKYRCASMQVSGVRSIKVLDERNQPLAVEVEVEPRDAHTKSHAGIFVRTGAQNVLPGRSLMGTSVPEAVSVDMILQDVRWELLALSTLEQHEINLPK